MMFNIDHFREFIKEAAKKISFSLAWHTHLAPPPLSGPATKKRTFFAASLTGRKRFQIEILLRHYLRLLLAMTVQ